MFCIDAWLNYTHAYTHVHTQSHACTHKHTHAHLHAHTHRIGGSGNIGSRYGRSESPLKAASSYDRVGSDYMRASAADRLAGDFSSKLQGPSGAAGLGRVGSGMNTPSYMLAHR